MEKIKIACDVRDSLPLEDFTELQGELKSLDTEDHRKLRDEILTTGFAFPVYVWRAPNKKKYVVGGHQRVKVLRQLQKEGTIIPKVPVVFIKARDINEAKRRILQDVSQYGRVESGGLYEFLKGTKIQFEDMVSSFRLPDVNMAQFGSAFYPDEKQVSFTAKSGKKEDDDTEETKEEFAHKCPKCDFEFND